MREDVCGEFVEAGSADDTRVTVTVGNTTMTADAGMCILVVGRKESDGGISLDVDGIMSGIQDRAELFSIIESTVYTWLGFAKSVEEDPLGVIHKIAKVLSEEYEKISGKNMEGEAEDGE